MLGRPQSSNVEKKYRERRRRKANRADAAMDGWRIAVWFSVVSVERKRWRDNDDDEIKICKYWTGSSSSSVNNIYATNGLRALFFSLCHIHAFHQCGQIVTLWEASVFKHGAILARLAIGVSPSLPLFSILISRHITICTRKGEKKRRKAGEIPHNRHAIRSGADKGGGDR